MSSKYFYAVAFGRNPGVYYTWNDCQKEVTGFNNAVFKKFTNEEDAWSFVGTRSLDEKLSTVSSPPKVDLLTDSSSIKVTTDISMNGYVKSKLLDRLQAIQDSIKEFQEKTIKELNSIKTEFLLDSSVTTKKCILLDIEDAPRVNECSMKRPRLTQLPSTSKKFCGDGVVNSTGVDQHSTFTFDDEGYLEVYTDGACTNNGRQGAKAGLGVWFGDGHALNISEPVTGRITNNSAEIEAAIMAIKSASLAGIRKIKVCTDSVFLISAITNWIKKWKKNNWKTTGGEAVKNKQELLALDECRQGLDVIFKHVKGHAGNYGNVQADALARAGAERCKPSRIRML